MEFINTILWDYIVPFVKQTAVIWAPLAALSLGWMWWVEYVQKAYLASLNWSVLHIKIPREVLKTPKAMELIFNALYQTGGIGNPFDRYWKGKQLAWHSLEIVSIEGVVYFFIRVETRFKGLVEHQIYSQYPDAEVVEVEDYTKFVPPYDPDNGWEYKGAEYTLDDKKGDWLPIKTYVDYGLDEKSLQLDEEQKVDPITPLLEFMGALQKGEQLWLQILIRAGAKRFVDKEGEEADWQKDGRAAIDKMLAEYSNKEIKEKQADGTEKVTKKVGGYANLPPHLKEQIDAAERNLAKYGFDFGMRVMYIAAPGAANGMRMPVEFNSAFRQFNSPNLNEIKMKNYTDDFNYPWQDWDNVRKNHRRKKLFKYFVERSWFYWPASDFFSQKPLKVLTTEELATIFHFPGRVLTTPTFERIEAKKSEPPSNLPI